MYEYLTLQWNLHKAGMLHSGQVSVACTFSWNHKLTDRTTQLKSDKKPNYSGHFMAETFLLSASKAFVIEKPLYNG